MSEIALTLSFSKCPTNICTWFIIQACSPLLCAPRTPLKRKWIWKKGEREVNERSLPYDKLQQYKWKRIAGIVSHTRMMIHLEFSFFFPFFPRGSASHYSTLVTLAVEPWKTHPQEDKRITIYQKKDWLWLADWMVLSRYPLGRQLP